MYSGACVFRSVASDCNLTEGNQLSPGLVRFKIRKRATSVLECDKASQHEISPDYIVLFSQHRCHARVDGYRITQEPTIGLGRSLIRKNGTGSKKNRTGDSSWYQLLFFCRGKAILFSQDELVS